MHVTIEGHGGANLVIALQAADGHGHIVDHAESFAVVGKGVVESAANADADLVGQALAGCQDRSASRQPEGVDQVAREGNFHFHFFARAEGAALQFLHVLRLVDQQNVLVGGGLRFQEIRVVGDAADDQLVADAAVFLGREDVLPDREVIGVTVDELEGEHGDPRSYL